MLQFSSTQTKKKVIYNRVKKLSEITFENLCSDNFTIMFFEIKKERKLHILWRVFLYITHRWQGPCPQGIKEGVLYNRGVILWSHWPMRSQYRHEMTNERQGMQYCLCFPGSRSISCVHTSWRCGETWTWCTHTAHSLETNPASWSE